MNQLLQPKQKVKTVTSNMDCEVEKFLGGGGQGEVYRADLNGAKVALKWYYPAQATENQKTALEALIKKGSPSDRFLWPIDLTTSKDIPAFGYIMGLREPQHKNIVDLMKGRTNPTFFALATTGMQLAHNFLLLHSNGLCYCDISFGNVFFDPITGDILNCDNDNVGIDGLAPISVLGTPRFMAPEIVRREALPSTRTDLFSLSVLLFYMMMIHHPLEGAREASIKCLDAPAMNKLYGTEPLFIFDPDDDSNHPIKGYHDNALTYWNIYPTFLKNLFIQSFTQGIRDPINGRVRESEWRKAMVRLRDSIIICQHCGSENFYDEEVLKNSGKLNSCWQCRKDFQIPPRIRIDKRIVMLNSNTKLYPHHVDRDKRYDFSTPVAEIARHPQNPNIWGLRNISSEKWNTTGKDGLLKDIEPGKSVTLTNETKINFGKAEGEIRS